MKCFLLDDIFAHRAVAVEGRSWLYNQGDGFDVASDFGAFFDFDGVFAVDAAVYDASDDAVVAVDVALNFPAGGDGSAT